MSSTTAAQLPPGNFKARLKIRKINVFILRRLLTDR